MGSFDSDVAWGGNKLSSLATHNVFGMQWARLNNGLVYLSESFRKMHSGCGRGSAVSPLQSESSYHETLCCVTLADMIGDSYLQ